MEVVSLCDVDRNMLEGAAAMVAELPADADAPLRAWFALGSPCVSVFVPTTPNPTGATLGGTTTLNGVDGVVTYTFSLTLNPDGVRLEGVASECFASSNCFVYDVFMERSSFSAADAAALPLGAGEEVFLS